jgi:pimeloyl-ACP methyl ester carboxylesterase
VSTVLHAFSPVRVRHRRELQPKLVRFFGVDDFVAVSDRDFAIPIFVFKGANDDFTPVQLAQEYVDGITAPQKHVVLIADAGHDAIITKSDEFLELLDQRVRRLTIPTGTDHSIGAVTSVVGTGSASNTFLGRAVVH